MTDLFHESTHPLMRHKLTYLKDTDYPVNPRDYADLLREVGILLTFEATQHMEFPTQKNSRSGGKITKQWPVIIPVVRSGLVMAEGVRSILPSHHMGHIGLFVDVETSKVIEFMVTMPTSLEDRYCIIVDPFIVSGTTARETIRIVSEYGVAPERIVFLTACASKQGHAFLSQDEIASKVHFFCGHIDRPGDEEEWILSFRGLNHRLYGTRNKRLILGSDQINQSQKD